MPPSTLRGMPDIWHFSSRVDNYKTRHRNIFNIVKERRSRMEDGWYSLKSNLTLFRWYGILLDFENNTLNIIALEIVRILKEIPYSSKLTSYPVISIPKLSWKTGNFASGRQSIFCRLFNNKAVLENPEYCIVGTLSIHKVPYLMGVSCLMDAV